MIREYKYSESPIFSPQWKKGRNKEVYFIGKYSDLKGGYFIYMGQPPGELFPKDDFSELEFHSIKHFNFEDKLIEVYYNGQWNEVMCST